MSESAPRFGISGRLAKAFVASKLTPIAIIASILLGVFAVINLPREEEPQIKVPMVDVYVAYPGASPTEVENHVTRPMEKLLWEIPNVEYLYSTSSPGGSMVVVRFKVGTNIEGALVRLNQKLQANFDRIPSGVSTPLIKPRTIDDVPVLAVTLHSAKLDPVALRRIAVQVEEAVKPVDMVAETNLIGGSRRALRVMLDPTALAAHGIDTSAVARALKAANVQSQNGSRPFGGSDVLIETGTFLRNEKDVGSVVVGVYQGSPVYLRDVATIADGPAEAANYVFSGDASGRLESAVTISVAKRPGANAIDVVNAVMARIEELKGRVIPGDVSLTVTRDYGHTAAEKSNELLLHMGIAVFGVALLILFFLGWRESLIVLLAIPSTLALTLLVFYLYGYTLNRITLFALIFSIGILVDDAIVVVENIVRHMKIAGAREKGFTQVALEAVDEVGNPTILATWAVIAAILPMAFVGGLMGPYMRPIPIGSTAAMLFSILIAFTVTPWAAVHVLRRHFEKETAAESKAGAGSAGSGDEAPADWSTRLYHKIMEPLLDHAGWRAAFLISVVVLLLGAISLVAFGLVKVKMLPFDNKSEFQIVIDTPEGTTLEDTTKVALEMADAIRTMPEVRDYQIYAGTAAPFNFNGLVRHYYARSGPNVADIQVNLVGKGERNLQSHDIALRARPLVAAVAKKYGAAVAVAEVPPGPPVLQTIVAEVYGPTPESRLKLATDVRKIMEETPGVVDIDWYVEAPQPEIRYVADKEKAALAGIAESDISSALAVASTGVPVDALHLPDEREDVPIRLELPDSVRFDPRGLMRLRLEGNGHLVPLMELVRMEKTVREPNIYHKNLKPVVYVTADVAGAIESPAYAIFDMQKKIAKLDKSAYGALPGRLPVQFFNQPFDENEPSMTWDGEWHITLEVFRDLGIAFCVVLVLIAMLMVGWFKSYSTPLVVMAAIPFSLIGILPAHWAMGAFFTATSMIGFMAGAGIVVRNSIILVDFIELRRSHGLALRDAVVEAGAVRFRPMLLTALAVVVGASVILADPIFQGLAISLMFGEIASLLISRMAVPVLYYMSRKNRAA